MGARSSRRAPGAPTWTEGTGWCPLHAEGAVPAPLIEATELKLFRTHRKDPDLTARGQQAGWWVLPEAPIRTRGAPRGEEGVGGVPADEHLRTQFFRDKETAEKNRGVGGGTSGQSHRACTRGGGKDTGWDGGDGEVCVLHVGSVWRVSDQLGGRTGHCRPSLITIRTVPYSAPLRSHTSPEGAEQGGGRAGSGGTPGSWSNRGLDLKCKCQKQLVLGGQERQHSEEGICFILGPGTLYAPPPHCQK